MRIPRLLFALACAACASDGSGTRDDYLRYVAFDVPVNEHVLLRWPERKMPLAIHLPPPPPEMFADPDAVADAVRDGVTDWTDVAGVGLPSFRFVDSAGEADIPIVWEREPSGDWYIAHCAWDIDPLTRRFGVSRILVTARYGNQREASLDDLYATLLHEMGHALGLRHSPDPADIMYPRVTGKDPAVSDRDRNTLRLLYSRPQGHRITGARSAD